MAAARQGTVTCGEPESTERMRGVAKGVRVIAVFKPAKHVDELRVHFAGCKTLSRKN